MKVKTLRPTYYKDFRCTGNDCRYNCCSKWGIHLSKDDYDRVRNARMSKELRAVANVAYKREKGGEAGGRYANVVMRDNEEMSCPFFNDERLCALQIECGYPVLSKTCKTFPRMLNQTGREDFEQGLSIGCEAVVELLLKETDGVAFTNEDSDINLRSTANHSLNMVKDNPLAAHYYDIKMLSIGILQAQAYSVDDRMLLLGHAFKGLSDLEKEGKFTDIPEFVDKMLASVEQPGLTDIFAKMDTSANELIKVTMDVIFAIQAVPSEREYKQRVLEGLGVGFIDDGENDQGGRNLSMGVDGERYGKAVERREKFTAKHPRIMENILVNQFHTQAMPIDTKLNLWDSYIRLVYLYLLIKLSVAGYIGEDGSESDFCHAVMMIGRCFTHSGTVMERVTAFIKENETATLAHLALLIKA